MLVRHRKLVLWLLLASLALSGPGCVRRRMTIRSNPPGALVYVDNHEIGTTPVSTDFIYYGTREIRLVKDGYETLVVRQPFKLPWYQYPPLDFVTENLVPVEIRDERNLVYSLTPQVIVPTDQLLSRAENLRRGTQAQAGVAPLAQPAGPPLPTGPHTIPPGGQPVPEFVPPPTVSPLPAP